MQFTGKKVEQPASTACLLARKCNRLARKMEANMRNAICVRTQTSKVPTQDILLVSSLFCGKNYITLVGRVMVDSIPCLNSLKDAATHHIPHQYSKEMSKSTDTVR